tara:strand:+ start:2998 stop:4104 length:1107 start_codon:yes stop_codon:yes gene_type:complete
MVFGGKIAFGDVLGGVAKSLDDRLKDNIKRTNDRSERIREYHVTRGQRKQEEFEKEQKELGEVLESLSNYMDKAGINIPEGMTKADFAAQLYKFGGGTITDGKKLIADLDEHYKNKGNIKGLIDQASLVTKGKGFGDYINNFVRRPETMIKVPDNLKGGVGFLKDVDITKGISEEMSTMFGDIKQADKFDVSGLTLDRSKMLTAEKYKQEKELYDIKLENAFLGNKKLQKEVAQLGTLDYNTIKANHKMALTDGLNRAGIDVDSAGKFQIQRTGDEFKKASRAYKNALIDATRTSQMTGSLNAENKSLLRSIASGARYYVEPTKATPDTQYQIGQMYTKKIGGETFDILYIGGNINDGIKIPSYQSYN